MKKILVDWKILEVDFLDILKDKNLAIATIVNDYEDWVIYIYFDKFYVEDDVTVFENCTTEMEVV